MRKAKPVFLKMMSTAFACFLFGSLLTDVKGLMVKVAVNRPATLPCIVHFPADDEVRWIKNINTILSIALHVKPAFKKRMRIFQPYLGEWNLHIDPVQLGDAALPIIRASPDMTFKEGDTGTLWCNATGSPTPDVRWSWKSPLQNEGIVQASEAEGNRLVLHNITRYYDNIYVCLASNTAGNDSREIRIHVNFGPEVEVFQNTVTAMLGQEVTLYCSVAAYPMDGKLEWVFQNNNSTICNDWKYNVSTDETMEKDYNTHFNYLTIRKDLLGDGDYGRYVCRTKDFSGGHSEKELIIKKPIEHD